MNTYIGMVDLCDETDLWGTHGVPGDLVATSSIKRKGREYIGLVQGTRRLGLDSDVYRVLG